MTDKAFFQGEYPSFEVLDASRVSGVVYAAFRKPETGEVFAFVSPVSSGRGEFVYKLQDESMGPGDVRCPERILALLTETDDAYSNEWRQRCREYHSVAAVAKVKAAAVREGTTIRMSEPLFFGKRYGSFTDFRYTGRGGRFVALRDGLACVRVSLGRDWKLRDFEVVS